MEEITYPRWVKVLYQEHLFLAGQGVYPAVLCTALCLGLFAARAYMTHTWTFYFLLWNLFLAWVPYLGSLWAMRLHKKHPKWWWALLIPGMLCIAFFPNAPYIITDFLHLAHRPPIPLWYDIGLITSFAWTGIVLAIYALRIMQEIVKNLTNPVISWAFALMIVALSGLGIYLGRFLRWNSWDLVVQPKAVLYDIAIRLRHPLGNLQTVGVTLLFSTLLFTCYLALTAGPFTKQS
ncbi:MAG: DUF1361 domain-containing protein [Anaerolineae bacterium]|nr:DUF1361 domain-containing protein [Anaerolineae bacterium]